MWQNIIEKQTKLSTTYIVASTNDTMDVSEYSFYKHIMEEMKITTAGCEMNLQSTPKVKSLTCNKKQN